MVKMLKNHDQKIFTRRDLMIEVLKTMVVSSAPGPLLAETHAADVSWRAINIMNFIRAEDPLRE